MFFLLLTILFSSCHKDMPSTQFMDYGQKTALFTEEINILDKENVNSFKNINVFGTTAKLLLNLKTYYEGQPINLCLYAQKKNVFWYEQALNNNCKSDNADLLNDLKIMSHEFKKLQVYFFTQDRRLDSQVLIKKNNLVLKIDDETMTFPLRNLGEDKIYPIQYRLPHNQFLKDDEVCFDVDENCVVTKNQCQNCEFGFYPVISSKCQKNFTKVCAVTACGARGLPACVRGYNYTGKSIEAGCYDNASSAYCQEGLSSHCDERGILICR